MRSNQVSVLNIQRHVFVSFWSKIAVLEAVCHGAKSSCAAKDFVYFLMNFLPQTTRSLKVGRVVDFVLEEQIISLL